MGTKRDDKGRRLEARRRGLRIETLERRALLATVTETFVAPSLSSLIAQAEKGKNTTPAQINLMVDALQAQLTSGPLANYNSGAVTSNGFIVESQSLEASFEANVDQQLGTQFPNNEELIILQGQRVIANLVSLNQQAAVGLVPVSSLSGDFQTTINSLTAGPIFAIGTKNSAITGVATALETELTTLEKALADGSLTLQQANTTLGAEAEAYRTSVHAGIQMTQLKISGENDAHVNALESASISIAHTSPGNAASQLSTAITTFDNQILGKNGLFSTHGALSKSKPSKLKSGTTNGQATSVFGVISGTSTIGATTTFTATLTTSNGSPAMGESVGFTNDGAFEGVAITNFTGVATLITPAATTASGTDAGGVVAYFASDTNYLSATRSGDLTTAGTPSTVSGVAGTATYGGPATLDASLASSSGTPLVGKTLSFSLGGTAVGTAVTNASGIAVLTNVPTSLAVGTNTAAVVASFAGDSGDASSASSGNLVITQAGSAIENVSGTAPFGGTATLNATFVNTNTGLGVEGETVNFVLDNTIVGTAVSGPNGVATLSGVSTSDAIGVHAGSVIATFGGDSNFLAASNATGDLVVTQASTGLAGVGGTASFGGTATLTADLFNTSTDQGISGQTVNFSLNGKSVGSAVTGSTGVATLSGVASSAGVGTVTGAVVASFAGTSDYADTTTTGNLVVSQAATAMQTVAGSSTFGGKATLTATLINSVTSVPIANELVSFTLNGVSVGSIDTGSNGVATLTNVVASDASGTKQGAVVASFIGDTNYAASNAAGDLVVSPAGTELGSLTGTGIFGGPATLNATLTSAVTGLGVSGETIDFELNGTSVGSGITNSAGLATLTGVANSLPVGNNPGVFTASFAGDANYNGAAKATGGVVISQSGAALGAVGGVATYGGTASLTATLTSTSTGQPISGQTVTFTLGGKSAGSAVTNSAGVASLSGVATTASAGTDTGAVVASFAGDEDNSPVSTTGNLIVGQAGTMLGSVSGSANFGGKATLTATLTSTVTSQPIAGETVDFTLGGVSEGSALTNASGVATVTTTAATTEGVGTDMNAVVASFSGGGNYQGATNVSGNLVVATAPTALTVSGTSPVGGPATLVAVLTSTVTGQPLSGQTVSFVLDTVSVGTAVTNASGIATLTGVATSDGMGTDTGGIVVNYAGDTDYAASQGKGDLTVS